MPTNTIAAPNIQAIASCTLYSGTVPGLNGIVSFAPSRNVGIGNASGQLNLLYAGNFTVGNATTPFTVNLGNCTDPFGASIAMQHVMLIGVVHNGNTTGQDFLIGGGTHPVLGNASIPVQAGNFTGNTSNGGFNLWYAGDAGYAIVPGSNDTLTINVAAGTNVPGQIEVWGRNA